MLGALFIKFFQTIFFEMGLICIPRLRYLLFATVGKTQKCNRVRVFNQVLIDPLVELIKNFPPVAFCPNFNVRFNGVSMIVSHVENIDRVGGGRNTLGITNLAYKINQCCNNDYGTRDLSDRSYSSKNF
jgi:hypothetical protein